VRSVVVVVVEPVWQSTRALTVGAVDEPVRPLPGHRLVETLDLAVRARPVGLGGEVLEAALAEELAEGATAGVGPGIVRHQPLSGDPVLLVEGKGAPEEADGGGGARVRVDLGVGEAGMVVDDGVHDVDAVSVVAVL